MAPNTKKVTDSKIEGHSGLYAAQGRTGWGALILVGCCGSHLPDCDARLATSHHLRVQLAEGIELQMPGDKSTWSVKLPR